MLSLNEQKVGFTLIHNQRIKTQATSKNIHYSTSPTFIKNNGKYKERIGHAANFTAKPNELIRLLVKPTIKKPTGKIPHIYLRIISKIGENNQNKICDMGAFIHLHGARFYIGIREIDCMRKGANEKPREKPDVRITFVESNTTR